MADCDSGVVPGIEGVIDPSSTVSPDAGSGIVDLTADLTARNTSAQGWDYVIGFMVDDTVIDTTTVFIPADSSVSETLFGTFDAPISAEYTIDGFMDTVDGRQISETPIDRLDYSVDDGSGGGGGCASDTDCPTGEICVNGACMTPSDGGGSGGGDGGSGGGGTGFSAAELAFLAGSSAVALYAVVEYASGGSDSGGAASPTAPSERREGGAQ